MIIANRANKTNPPVLVAVVEPCVQRDEGAADDVCGGRGRGDGGGGLLVQVRVLRSATNN